MFAVMLKAVRVDLLPPFVLVAVTAAGLMAAVARLDAKRDAGNSPPPAASPRLNTAAPAPRVMPGPYRAEAIRVVDGDTFEARLRIWFNQDVTVLVRLEGVDAPEMRGRCEQESRMARQSRDALAAILASGEVIVRDLATDKYNGRAVGRAFVADRASGAQDDVAALMEAGGYARPYAGRSRSPWCGAAGVVADRRPAR